MLPSLPPQHQHHQQLAPPPRSLNHRVSADFSSSSSARPSMDQQSSSSDHNQQQLRSLVDQTLAVQSESAQSAQRSAAMGLQAEAAARRAAATLGLQGAQLDAVNARLDVVASDVDHADAQSAYLDRVNRSMFLPTGKRPDAPPPPTQPSTTTTSTLSSWASWLGFGSGGSDEDSSKPGGGDETPDAPPVITPRGSSLADPSAYKPMVGEWATEEERALSSTHERDIESSLDTISQSVKNLKFVGAAIGIEADRQSNVIRSIGDKVDSQKDKVEIINRRIGKQLKK